MPNPQSVQSTGIGDEVARLLTREIARSMDFSGALFLDARFTAPWAIRSRRRAEFAMSVNPEAKRVIVFHVVLEGLLWVSVKGGSSAELAAGDVVIFPYADQHVMRGRENEAPVPVERLLPPLPWPGPPLLRHGGGGETTILACSYLFSADLHLHPIFAAMPRQIVVRSGDPVFRDWLLANLRFALAEAIGRDWQASALARKLPELLFLQCLTRYAKQQPEADWAWLRAATDPVTGRAIALIHRHIKRPWTLNELARDSGTSRSVLSERFNRLLGQAPMHYVAHWRLQLAARALRSSNRSITEIAESVGYRSESGFNRAFKRRFGVSPGNLRS